MAVWAIQDAKAKFSELIETCLTQGSQVVTKRGEEVAVIVPIDEWRKIQSIHKPTLKDLLLADDAKAELVLPQRSKLNHRKAPVFE